MCWLNVDSLCECYWCSLLLCVCVCCSMGDYAEQQEQELEALEAIYEQELSVLSRDYPNMSVQIDLPSNQELGEDEEEGEDDFTLSLIVELGEKYPDEAPVCRVEGLEEHFSQQRVDKVIEKLGEVAAENLGMVMVFTLVSAVQEEMGVLCEELANKAQAVIEEEKEKKEAENRKKFEGTVVTPESFRAWKQRFDAEQEALKEKKEKEREALLAGRLTGKQLFLKDATLSLSDVAFIEQEKDKVEIDESLFDEDLDGLDGLDDSEAEDEE